MTLLTKMEPKATKNYNKIHITPICCFLEIELVSETTEDEAKAAEGDKPQLTEGVTVAYTKPAAQVNIFVARKI